MKLIIINRVELMKTGIEIIAEERQRQMDVEGWTLEHDKLANNAEQLAQATALIAAEIDRLQRLNE